MLSRWRFGTTNAYNIAIYFRLKKHNYRRRPNIFFILRTYIFVRAVISHRKRSRSVCLRGACMNNALQIEQSPRLRDLLFHPQHHATTDAGNLRQRSLRRVRLAATPAVATRENNNFYAPTFNSYKTCVNPFGWITEKKKKEEIFSLLAVALCYYYYYCIVLVVIDVEASTYA